MRWLPVAILLGACGGSKDPCTTGTCVIRGITVDLPLTDPGSYLIAASSPGGPDVSCSIYVSSSPPQAYCTGMSATIDGGNVKGLVLPASFTPGGLLSVTRNGAPFLSGSFEVRQGTSMNCNCSDPYAVVYPGQGS